MKNVVGVSVVVCRVVSSVVGSVDCWVVISSVVDVPAAVC